MVVEIDGRAEVWYPPEIKNFSVSILESAYQKKKLRGERLPFLKTLMLAVTCTSSHLMTQS